MKNLIFGNNDTEKYAKVLAIFAGLLAVLFLPMSYTLPGVLIIACIFMAIRSEHTWKRVAWCIAALMVLSQVIPWINLLVKVSLVVGVFLLAQKRDQKEERDSDNAQD